MSASTPAGPSTAAPPQRRATAAEETTRAHDWAGLAATPEFQALHRSRRRFTLTGIFIQTAALLVVMGLFGWAPDSMAKPAIGSITWALVAGAGLVVLTFVMGAAYTAKSSGWERMAETVLAHADAPRERADGRPDGRFAR